MCRLQHSLGIVWRPQTPPLTAPTSNRSRQPCRRGPGATRPSSHAGRSGRCQSIAWGRGSGAAGPRGALRGATGDGCSGGLGQEGTGSRREAGPAPVFPGPGGGAEGARDGRALQLSRTARCEEALRFGPAGRAGAALAWSQPWGPEAASLAFPSLACLSESKSETARIDRSASARPARTPLSLGSPLRAAAPLRPLRQYLRGRQQAPGPWGLGHRGSFCATWKV